MVPLSPLGEMSPVLTYVRESFWPLETADFLSGILKPRFYAGVCFFGTNRSSIGLLRKRAPVQTLYVSS